uniref:Uncharacterized protein n=1 Tax=Chromera velia CCMP2878 TaxID=1169474 RepID=A0A0G4I974_9ALVE|eukprot:Cvel_12196.t1-p1 / transcript=Cvel_12196.t1 / gene=Cvel_12196 / organism=Chromera_velia_CCMP2878 / gene_product=hypothetical protein / transcript_product=hypothetical protein / location=Cvel_scaffold788:32665-37741(+) / protein_length=271 / sequence_SO=supercontig / SO=protein_coding / is_pseudo=false
MLHYMQKKKIRAPFKSLDLTNAHLSPGKLRLLLATLPKSTEELKLGRRSFIRDVVSQFLGSLGDSGQNGTESYVASLRSLWLQECLDDEKVLQLFPLLPLGLEELNLGWNYRMGRAGWEALGERLKSLEGLKRLDLSGCMLNDGKVLQLFPSLPRGLEELNLRDNEAISLAGWEALGARVKSLEKLKKLVLTHGGLDEEKALQLFPSLPLGLEQLNLQCNGAISLAGWEALGTRLKSLEKLKRLVVTHCGLGNQEVTPFFSSLPIGLIRFY